MIERLRVGPIGENVYILPLERASEQGNACILVDPGDEAARILAFLESRDLVPVLIVATHGHLDHIAAVPELLAALGAGGTRPPLAIHAGDAAYLGARGEETNRRCFAAIHATGFFRNYWRPLPEPDLLLEDGASLADSPWRVIHTPGHSAGSICLHNAEQGLLISGDTLFQNGVGRTDCPDSDDAALDRSLKERLLGLPPETRVFPGHGEPTTIGREAEALRLLH